MRRLSAVLLSLLQTSLGGERLAAAQAGEPVVRASGAARALVKDVERIVDSEESAGWFIDDVAYTDSKKVLLESVCRVTASARMEALELLRQLAEKRPSPELLYERQGELSKEASEALTARRRRDLLARAIADADQDCPFWVEPDPEFLGRQTDRLRFTLSVETGGIVQLRQTAGTLTFGGGGYGRLLPGVGIADGWTLLAGAEFGGGAMLRPKTEPTEFVINYFPAIPVVLRHHGVSWHYDLELAAIGLFQADDGNISYGGRLGTAVGVKALLTRGVLPWAGIAAAYDHYVPSGGRPRAHFLRGGLRVGVIWDP